MTEIQFKGLTDKESLILKKEITGSKNSTFSTLLDQLQNTDWVNTRLKYVENKMNPAYVHFANKK